MNEQWEAPPAWMTIQDALAIYVSHHLTTTGVSNPALVRAAITILGKHARMVADRFVSEGG